MRHVVRSFKTGDEEAMTDMHCSYSGNRDETMVAYLYDDITPLERAAFESHMSSCEACRDELSALRGVRLEMRDWQPPTFQPVTSNQYPARPPRSFWADVPVWAQAAAALLVVGVAAGAANITVHHDAAGFTVRTGWMTQPAAAAAPAPVAVADPAPWRADLAKLESEIRASRASGPAVVQAAAVSGTPARASAGDEELLRKVKALLAESEKKQETELALRIAQVARDRQAERIADMGNIDRMMRLMQASTTNTGFEVQQLRQNQNTLLQRVSQSVR